MATRLEVLPVRPSKAKPKGEPITAEMRFARRVLAIYAAEVQERDAKLSALLRDKSFVRSAVEKCGEPEAIGEAVVATMADGSRLYLAFDQLDKMREDATGPAPDIHAIIERFARGEK